MQTGVNHTVEKRWVKARETLANAQGIIRKGTQRGTKICEGPCKSPQLLGDETTTIVLVGNIVAAADVDDDDDEEEDEEGFGECTLLPPEEEAVLWC